jgi:hypothetical protein
MALTVKPSSHYPSNGSTIPDRNKKSIKSIMANVSWFLENVGSSGLPTKRTALEAITLEVDATLSSIRTTERPGFPAFQINFDIDWDLPNFLRGQTYGTTWEIAVERAITVTGSSGNAQALSCVDYMSQTWPSSGREVVRVLQKAVMSPSLSFSGKQNPSEILLKTYHSRLPCGWDGA